MLLQESLPLSVEELNEIVACPTTKKPLRLVEGTDAFESSGGETYAWTDGNWNLIPAAHRDSAKWDTWDQLQENGVVSYQMDPTRNLAVGRRDDAAAFAAFCKFAGVVLDVGCGPQPWPAYFADYAPGTRFVGVDPLIGASSPQYRQVRALAEHLPFVDESFDRVLFSTSLDHFVDPSRSLLEARRVCKRDGTICIWLGEKHPNAPKPAVSPEWYVNLKRPVEAEDPFHFKRLRADDVETYIARCGLTIEEQTILPAGEFRWNAFYRLRPS